jgi:hypothetical protein
METALERVHRFSICTFVPEEASKLSTLLGQESADVWRVQAETVLHSVCTFAPVKQVN